MNFKGWGKLSREFLEMTEEGNERSPHATILNTLWNTNDNLMEILSNKYRFTEKLEKNADSDLKDLFEINPEDLNHLYLSAPVKRMIWQTILVIKEIISVMGCYPERIFIEMAREKEKILNVPFQNQIK